MENGEKKTVSRKVIDREVIMRKYHVHIKNFRNLKDVKVTLSPLTILTGENGSGKSTLFKALLFLKHNHDHEAAKKLKYVIDDDINLGGWEHIANDPKKPISIKITEETWGYDHEVEEIYDIDNCPFELNPTEERYAHWKETRKDTFDLFKGNFSNVRKKCAQLTKMSNSNEYCFEDGRLTHINVIIADKWSFNYEYLHRPFPEWIVRYNNSAISLEYLDCLCRINDISVSKNKISSELSLLLCNVAFSSLLLWIDVDYSASEVTECVVDEFDIQPSSNYIENLSYFVYSILKRLDEKIMIKKFNELHNLSRNIIGFKKLLSLGLFFNILSVGTVREIPKSRYLNEYLNKDTYYGMFDGLKKISKLTESADYTEANHWSYIERTLNHWINKFEFGNSISIFSKTEVSTIALDINGRRKIRLAEASSGALQFIPVIYFLTTNPSSSSVFLIQQPELHLHPMMQSRVVDFIIDRVNPNFESLSINSNLDLDPSWEIGLLKDKISSFLDDFTLPKFIVLETHSEHIIKKLQVLVSQGMKMYFVDWRYLESGPEEIEPKSVQLKDALSIYYFAKDKNGNTKAIEMELDDNGFFKTETPKGFFDESLELNRQLLLGRN
jgi:AAA15 family ATPase/GTPase